MWEIITGTVYCHIENLIRKLWLLCSNIVNLSVGNSSLNIIWRVSRLRWFHPGLPPIKNLDGYVDSRLFIFLRSRFSVGRHFPSREDFSLFFQGTCERPCLMGKLLFYDFNRLLLSKAVFSNQYQYLIQYFQTNIDDFYHACCNKLLYFTLSDDKSKDQSEKDDGPDEVQGFMFSTLRWVSDNMRNYLKVLTVCRGILGLLFRTEKATPGPS